MAFSSVSRAFFDFSASAALAARILAASSLANFRATAAGMAANPQTAKKPLTKDQVMGLVKGSVPSPRVAEIVRDNGIDFEPTEDYFRALRAA